MLEEEEEDDARLARCWRRTSSVAGVVLKAEKATCRSGGSRGCCLAPLSSRVAALRSTASSHPLPVRAPSTCARQI